MRINSIALSIIVLLCLVTMGLNGGIQNTNFSVTSSPQAIFWAFFTGSLAIFSPRKKRTDNSEIPVGHWRRFIAVHIDAFIFMAFAMSLSIMPILYVEYLATGHWQWSYVREKAQFRDILSILEVFLLFYGLYFYFYKHAALNCPTAGQYIMGYRIVPTGKGPPKYGERVFHGAFNLWLGIFFLYGWSKINDGNYQWDKDTNTKAIRQV